jgi:hypothetical protein
MTFWPLLICTGLYVVTACGFARDGNGPLAVAFGGYALANIGFPLAGVAVIPSNPMGLRQGSICPLPC